MAKGTGKAYYMISVVAQRYNIHPQTLRLYEREGLLKPSRTDGNTRLYSDEDLERLETILFLPRGLGLHPPRARLSLRRRCRSTTTSRRSSSARRPAIADSLFVAYALGSAWPVRVGY